MTAFEIPDGETSVNESSDALNRIQIQLSNQDACAWVSLCSPCSSNAEYARVVVADGWGIELIRSGGCYESMAPRDAMGALGEIQFRAAEEDTCSLDVSLELYFAAGGEQPRYLPLAATGLLLPTLPWVCK